MQAEGGQTKISSTIFDRYTPLNALDESVRGCRYELDLFSSPMGNGYMVLLKVLRFGEQVSLGWLAPLNAAQNVTSRSEYL